MRPSPRRRPISFNEGAFLNENSFAYLSVTNPDGGIPLIAFYNYFPRLTAPAIQQRKNKTFAQELRLASNGTNTIDYVLGAYYSREKQKNISNQYNPGVAQYAEETDFDLHNPEYGDLNWPSRRNITFVDKAFFGELTWRITPKWQITGGARVFWQSFENDYYQAFPICGFLCGDSVTPGQEIGASAVSQQRKFHDQIFKINTSYDLSADTKVYATYSEGFRRGGANTVSTSGYFASLPDFATFSPDLARNYEIGIKGKALNSLSYTVSAFQIDWNDFQFEGLTPSALPAVFNGNKARSRGLEVEINAALSRKLNLTVGYSYIDAKLTEDFEIFDLPIYSVVTGESPILAISGAKGARLPGSAKHSATLALDYQTDLPSFGDGKWMFSAGANGSYRSSILPGFPSSSTFFYKIPKAFTANARIGLERDTGLSVDFTVRNLTGALARSSGVPAEFTGIFSQASVARPRTYTLGIHYRY